MMAVPKEQLVRPRPEAQGDGFTLPEVLLVLVIIGILASIVIFAVKNMSAEAATSTCKADLHAVQTAVEAYRSQMGNYPDGAAAGGTGVKTDSDATTANAVSAQSGAGSELLQPSTASATDPNVTVTPRVGPWLRDLPANGKHYSIIVANDGSGKVTVSDAAGAGQPDCAGVS